MTDMTDTYKMTQALAAYFAELRSRFVVEEADECPPHGIERPEEISLADGVELEADLISVDGVFVPQGFRGVVTVWGQEPDLPTALAALIERHGEDAVRDQVYRMTAF